MKTFKQFINENIQDESEKLKNLVIEKYKDYKIIHKGLKSNGIM